MDVTRHHDHPFAWCCCFGAAVSLQLLLTSSNWLRPERNKLPNHLDMLFGFPAWQTVVLPICCQRRYASCSLKSMYLTSWHKIVVFACSRLQNVSPAALSCGNGDHLPVVRRLLRAVSSARLLCAVRGALVWNISPQDTWYHFWPTLFLLNCQMS